MKTPFRVGKTCYLRPIEPEEGPTVVPWLIAADLTGPFATGFPTGEDAARRAIAAATRDDAQVCAGIALRADDRLVGVARLVRIRPQRRSAELRLALAPPPARRGLETVAREAAELLVVYAFETLNLNRVFAHVPADDKAARARCSKLGLTDEGVLRQDAWRDGRYVDVAVMSILASEARVAARSRSS